MTVGRCFWGSMLTGHGWVTHFVGRPVGRLWVVLSPEKARGLFHFRNHQHLIHSNDGGFGYKKTHAVGTWV